MKVIPTNLVCITNNTLSKNDVSMLCRYNSSCANMTFGRKNHFAYSHKLRKLYTLGIPCMYTGITMIDSNYVDKLLNNKFFQQKGAVVLSKLAKFCASMFPFEHKVFTILEQRAKIHPEKNLHDLMAEVVPFHQKLITKKEFAIFSKIEKMTANLPPEQYKQVQDLIRISRQRINGEAVYEEFSAKEFLYRLDKIILHIHNKNKNIRNDIAQLTEETNKLANKNADNLLMYRKNIIDNAYTIFSSSSLFEDSELSYLMQNAKASLNNEKIKTHFSRKAFIYKLFQIVDEEQNPILYENLLKLVGELPTSGNDLSAYILKYSQGSSEKIAYMLLSPSFATIEHIKPRSCGGMNRMENYGGACARANSERSSIDLDEQYKKRNTKKHTQMQIDRLIELANQGIFKKYKIDIQYIIDFKNAIFEGSKGKIKLDISKLKIFKRKPKTKQKQEIPIQK